MWRRILTTVLVLACVSSVAAGPSLNFPSVSASSQSRGPATGTNPTDVQMDRDFVDSPRTQSSSTIGIAIPRFEAATLGMALFVAPALRRDERPAAGKRDHVIRI
jgi:hypothetical protein